MASQDTRGVLVGRKLVQGKLLDVELSIRGILRGYALKVRQFSRGRFEARIHELVPEHTTLERVIGAMLGTTSALVRVHQAPPGDAEDRARRQDLPSVDEYARG